ncbi:hypothetical protein GCM10027168_30990 [Streptomyces capparidis]
MKAADREQELRDRPGDLASWLSYGDWLLARGDARGELIRLEQRRARVGPAGREALEREIAALVREHRPDWEAELPPGVTALARRYGFATKVAVAWSDDAPALIKKALEGPFVTALRIGPVTGEDDDEDEDDWEEDDDGVPVPPPVRAGALAALDLSRIVELDLSYLRIGDPGAMALGASPTVGRIRTLDLRYCGIGDPGLAVLAASPHLRAVRCLRLQHNALTGLAMLSLGRFEELTELDLRYNRIGEEGVDALLAAPFADSLGRLLLYRDDVGEAGARKLAHAPHLPPALRSLWRSA